MNQEQRNVRKTSLADYYSKVPDFVLDNQQKEVERHFAENSERAKLNADELNVIAVERARRQR